MIAFVRGVVASRSSDSAVIDVGGVGYLVLMPESHVAALDDDTETCVHVHTYVREDQLTLFGFVDAASRLVFGKLIGINKVGPRLALSILSTFTLPQLQEVAVGRNIGALKRIPGVGTKTAERLALELEDVLGSLELPSTGGAGLPVPIAAPGRAPAPVSAPVQGLWDQARSAMRNFGYVDAEIEPTLALVRAENPELESMPEAQALNLLLRRSLALLKRS